MYYVWLVIASGESIRVEFSDIPMWSLGGKKDRKSAEKVSSNKPKRRFSLRSRRKKRVVDDGVTEFEEVDAVRKPARSRLRKRTLKWKKGAQPPSKPTQHEPAETGVSMMTNVTETQATIIDDTTVTTKTTETAHQNDEEPKEIAADEDEENLKILLKQQRAKLRQKRKSSIRGKSRRHAKRSPGKMEKKDQKIKAEMDADINVKQQTSKPISETEMTQECYEEDDKDEEESTDEEKEMDVKREKEKSSPITSPKALGTNLAFSIKLTPVSTQSPSTRSLSEDAAKTPMKVSTTQASEAKSKSLTPSPETSPKVLNAESESRKSSSDTSLRKSETEQMSAKSPKKISTKSEPTISTEITDSMTITRISCAPNLPSTASDSAKTRGSTVSSKQSTPITGIGYSASEPNLPKSAGEASPKVLKPGQELLKSPTKLPTAASDLTKSKSAIKPMAEASTPASSKSLQLPTKIIGTPGSKFVEGSAAAKMEENRQPTGQEPRKTSNEILPVAGTAESIDGPLTHIKIDLKSAEGDSKASKPADDKTQQPTGQEPRKTSKEILPVAGTAESIVESLKTEIKTDLKSAEENSKASKPVDDKVRQPTGQEPRETLNEILPVAGTAESITEPLKTGSQEDSKTPKPVEKQKTGSEESKSKDKMQKDVNIISGGAGQAPSKEILKVAGTAEDVTDPSKAQCTEKRKKKSDEEESPSSEEDKQARLETNAPKTIEQGKK